MKVHVRSICQHYLSFGRIITIITKLSFKELPIFKPLTVYVRSVCFSVCIFYLGINKFLIYRHYCIIELKLCQETGHRPAVYRLPEWFFDSFHHQVMQSAESSQGLDEQMIISPGQALCYTSFWNSHPDTQVRPLTTFILFLYICLHIQMMDTQRWFFIFEPFEDKMPVSDFSLNTTLSISRSKNCNRN